MVSRSDVVKREGGLGPGKWGRKDKKEEVLDGKSKSNLGSGGQGGDSGSLTG